MPRCRLTRTDAAVKPVRSAISGPVKPSTSRRTSVSRYASGSERTASSAACASAWAGPASWAARSVRQLDVIGAAAVEVGGAVAGNHGNPAAERRRIAQSVQAIPGGEEDVLDQVVHVGARAPAPAAARGRRARSDRTAGRTHADRRRAPAPTSRPSSDACAASNLATPGRRAGQDGTQRATSICARRTLTGHRR